MEKVCILGQGNIGTFLGAAMKGYECDVVHFVRPSSGKRANVRLQFNDRRKGYKVKKGSFYSYDLITDPIEMQAFKYIVFPINHYQWKKAIEDYLPYLTDHQLLVLMGNVWDEFDWFSTQITIPYCFAFPNFGGGIVHDTLRGWLTPHFTTGITHTRFEEGLKSFSQLLRHFGFKPRLEKDIKAWHITHFAWIAGIMTEAARQNGFQVMTKKWVSLSRAYRLTRECMDIVASRGISVYSLPEGKGTKRPIWLSVLMTYLVFMVPGLAKGIDATMNIEDWKSYGRRILHFAQTHKIETKLLETYQDLFEEA